MFEKFIFWNLNNAVPIATESVQGKTEALSYVKYATRQQLEKVRAEITNDQEASKENQEKTVQEYIDIIKDTPPFEGFKIEAYKKDPPIAKVTLPDGSTGFMSFGEGNNRKNASINAREDLIKHYFEELKDENPEIPENAVSQNYTVRYSNEDSFSEIYYKNEDKFGIKFLCVSLLAGYDEKDLKISKRNWRNPRKRKGRTVEM